MTPVGTTTFTYYNGSTVNGTGTSAAPTNFGTYTVVASFTSSNNSYTNATSNPVTFKITPAPPTVTVVDNGERSPATRIPRRRRWQESVAWQAARWKT